MVENVTLKNYPMEESRPKSGRIHPHKFTMWVAIGSIIMMFAGLTSAYIVKSKQAYWTEIRVPDYFWYSTAAIILSSVTMMMSLRAFKQREMQNYRKLLLVTLLLGVAFVVLQWFGFRALWDQGVHWAGSGAGQFLYIIAGLHALHVAGGIIALLVMSIKAFFGKIKTYSSVPLEVVGTYWHFVDILWIYLLLFFLFVG